MLAPKKTLSQWEGLFRSWGNPPSKTETEKCENAERIVTQAISDSEDLDEYNISVFSQGSFKNRTNIPRDSDVDICVRLNDYFLVYYPQGKSNADFNNHDIEYTYTEFKQAVYRALVKRFGMSNVTWGNKALTVSDNSYRVIVDILPAWEYRHYSNDGSYIKGVAFKPDSGGRIDNYPEQTYENGVAKNSRTSKRYKTAIRIIKNLRNDMQDSGVTAANDIASFLIESLVYNVPDADFYADSYTRLIRNVLSYTYNYTKDHYDCSEWAEVNGIKYLFHSTQPWTRQQAHNFISAAWNYIGYR